jgi:hypothetical protein
MKVMIDMPAAFRTIKRVETDSQLREMPAGSSCQDLSVETVLSSLPAASDTERLLLVLIHSADTGSRIELRQQSFSKSIGWFTQSTVQLEPGQVAALRNALGLTGGKTNRLPREFSTVTPAAWQPRVVHADSA